jgi:hypothetical protein
MKLILRIDTNTDKNTGSGNCPCCHYGSDYREYYCTITENPCKGDLANTPGDCPLEEES